MEPFPLVLPLCSCRKSLCNGPEEEEATSAPSFWELLKVRAHRQRACEHCRETGGWNNHCTVLSTWPRGLCMEESPKTASQFCYSSFPHAAVRAFWARWMLINIPIQHSAIRGILISVFPLFKPGIMNSCPFPRVPRLCLPCSCQCRFLKARLVFCCLCGLCAAPSDLRGTATLNTNSRRWSNAWLQK